MEIRSRLSSQRWLRWGLVLAWMGLIFAISAQPTLMHSPDAITDVVLKKLGHMAEYGVLAILIWWAWQPRQLALDWRVFLAALAAAVCYAVTDEWHQTFVPGRTGTIYDWMVDVAGAGIALVGLRMALLRRGKDERATPSMV